MDECEACRDLGEMCHDCKVARPKVMKVFDHEGRRADAAMKKLERLRASEKPRLKERLALEQDLRDLGLQTNSLKREKAGERQRVVVGQKSGFYNPAVHIANSIRDALDPNQPPPRKWVPKKRPPQELKRVFREDGRINSNRYHGWPLDEVAEVNPGFLEFLSGLSCATDEDKSRIRLAIIKARAKAGGK
jgi:hypothetical protein